MMAILKATGGPGSIPFLILCLAIGIVLIYVWPRRPRLGIAWLVTVVSIYLVLAVPAVAHAIADRLPRVSAPARSSDTPIASLFILDGDNKRGRVRMAQRVFASDRPATIWVLGGDWIVDAMPREGVPYEAFRVDGSATTTRLQLIHIDKLLKRAPPGRAAVIASRVHAPRVAALVEMLGLAVDVLAAPLDVEPAATGAARFIPSYAALRLSRDALYEHAALIWYRRQGWIRSTDRAAPTAAAGAPIGR